MKENFLCRTRKFNPLTFFTSVLHLASSTNHDGYITSLHRTWRKCGLKLTETPAKSSLSEFRDKVSYRFFRDIFEQDLDRHAHQRKTFRGHYVYAIDGDHLDLPATKDLIKNGYRGFPILKNEETHYLKMYTVQAVDLINGIVTKFSHSHQISEIAQARQLVNQLEKNSITIYDRLHQCYETALAHKKADNYFFVRVKDRSPKAPLAVQNFCRSRRKSQWIDLVPSAPLRRRQMPSLQVRLIKVRNKRTKAAMVFMTNVPEGTIKNKEAGDLYQRRWGVESSFKDLTDKMKMCQWHTQKLSGVLQEIYALLWLANNVRRLGAALTKTTRNWLGPVYQKSNFKLIITILVDQFDLLIRGHCRKLHQILTYWAQRSLETRQHLSRLYPRQVKRHGKRYTNVSRVIRRPIGA